MLRHIYTIIFRCTTGTAVNRLDDEEETKMCQVEQPGEVQSENNDHNKFKMILETGLLDNRFFVFIQDDEDTDEDVLSDGGSDYGEDGEDVMVDEVMEFDDDDVCTFVDRAIHFLDNPRQSLRIRKSY